MTPETPDYPKSFWRPPDNDFPQKRFRSRNRNPIVRKVVKALIQWAAIIAADAYLLMLIFGGIHATYRNVPNLGYAWCLAVIFLWQAVIRSVVSE